jgi:CotH kinase protein/Secretion system C-terminal sorting domain/Chitobiase/beta-hexosaminidase C-terminal domain
MPQLMRYRSKNHNPFLLPMQFHNLRFWLLAYSLHFATALLAQKPSMSLPAGQYPSGQQIALTGCPTIRYTTTGDEVRATSPLYAMPLLIPQTMVLRARCFQDTTPLAASITQTYLINEQFTLPIVSLATDNVGMFDAQTGIYALGDTTGCNFFPFPCANFWQEWERAAHIEFFEPNGNVAFHQQVGIKIDGGWTKAFPKKSLRIQFDHPQFGEDKLHYALFPNEKPNVDTFKNIILRNGGNSYADAFFRDAFQQRLMKNENTDYIAYRPTHLFINGNYWGIHEMREREEKSYLRQNGRIASGDSIDLIRFNSDSYAFPYVKVFNGSDSAFFAFYTEVKEKNPMNFPVYYDFLQKRLDLPNYIDYFATRIFINDNDWVGAWTNNIKIWRPQQPNGRWRYLLWDLDWGLGGIGDLFNGQVSYNKLYYTRHPISPNEHSEIFDYILLNIPFCFSFINRFADLMNTTFQPKNMATVANAMRDELQPDIQKDFNRWQQNNATQWSNQVDVMLNYGTQRLSFCRSHIVSEFNLPKTVDITLDVVPKGAGKIHLNTITAPQLPWTGVYFDGVPVTMEVIPAEGYQFLYWKNYPLLTGPNYKRLENIMVSENTHFIAYLEQINATNEPTKGESIRLFPNPSNDCVTIKTEKKIETLEVLDMNGKLILQQHPNQNMVTLDLRQLSAGQYQINVDGVIKNWQKIQ